MRQSDEGFFIYKPESEMTDNLHLGDQGCHSNRRREGGVRERGDEREG